MERQLQQLDRDLETFASPDDPNDMFFTKMAISFSHACIWLQVWGIVLWVYCGNADLEKIKSGIFFGIGKTKLPHVNFRINLYNKHTIQDQSLGLLFNLLILSPSNFSK